MSIDASLPEILQSVRELASGRDAGSALHQVCQLLRRCVSHYDWVGYYLAVPGEKMLALGPFDGEPTDHLKIPYGTGICGQAAQLLETVVVPDVTAESNYLACGAKTRSEIVVPVFHGGELVGELDIDSHTASPFTDADTELLEGVAAATAPLAASILGDATTK